MFRIWADELIMYNNKEITFELAFLQLLYHGV